jgi:hypothetical protein
MRGSTLPTTSRDRSYRVNPLVGGTSIGRGYSVVDRVIAFIGELHERQRQLWRRSDDARRRRQATARPRLRSRGRRRRRAARVSERPGRVTALAQIEWRNPGFHPRARARGLDPPVVPHLDCRARSATPKLPQDRCPPLRPLFCQSCRTAWLGALRVLDPPAYERLRERQLPTALQGFSDFR